MNPNSALFQLTQTLRKLDVWFVFISVMILPIIGNMPHVNSVLTQLIETFVVNFSIVVFLFCTNFVMALILVKLLHFTSIRAQLLSLSYHNLLSYCLSHHWVNSRHMSSVVCDKMNHCIWLNFLNFSTPVHPKVQFLHQGQAAFLWLLTLYQIKCHQGSWSQGCSSELSQPRVWLSHHNHQHLPQHSHNPSIKDGHEFFGTIWNGKVG